MADGIGTAPAKVNPKLAEPSRVFDDEILDWDLALDTPPPAQRSGRIEVTLGKLETGPSSV